MKKPDITPSLPSAVPEVTVTPMNENQEFIVLACDGIWDVLTSQEVVDFIRPKLAEGQNPSRVRL